MVFFFFSSRRRHTRCLSDWSSDVCSSDLRRTRLLRRARGTRGRPTPGSASGPLSGPTPGSLLPGRVDHVDHAPLNSHVLRQENQPLVVSVLSGVNLSFPSSL